MSAADKIWAAGVAEARILAAKRWTPVVLAAVALLVFAYCSGRSAGERRIRTAVVDSMRHVLADSTRALEARLVADAIVTTHQSAIATRERIVYREAAAKVTPVSDTVLRVDSVLVHVPAPVVQVIARCDSVVTADSLTIVAVAAQLHDMTLDRDVWRARAELDERTQPRPPRFGFKTGLGAGVVLVAAVLHFLK
jgi:hypothetical protein